MNKFNKILLTSIAASSFLSQTSLGESGQLEVRATVTEVCTAKISGGSATGSIENAVLNFGNYISGQSTDTKQTTNLTITCSKPNSPYSLIIEGERKMTSKDNPDKLNYTLKINDNVLDADAPYKGTTTTDENTTVELTGIMPGGQRASAGDYSNSHIMTVNFDETSSDEMPS